MALLGRAERRARSPRRCRASRRRRRTPSPARRRSRSTSRRSGGTISLIGHGKCQVLHLTGGFYDARTALGLGAERSSLANASTTRDRTACPRSARAPRAPPRSRRVAAGGRGRESSRRRRRRRRRSAPRAGSARRRACRIARAVPPLVVVEDPLRHRLDAEALEHPEADLRMALEHSRSASLSAFALRRTSSGSRACRGRGGSREPDQLDRRLVGAEPAGDPRGVLADALRVAAGVGIALVDRLREALRRAVRAARSGCPRAARGSRGGTTRPRRRARGSCRPSSPSRARCPRAGSARRGPAPCVGKVATPALTVTASIPRSERRDALDDRARHRRRLPLVLPGQEDGELVAAEPERLAALPQPRRDLAEHAGRRPDGRSGR